LDWAFPDINGVDLLKYVRGSLQSCVPAVFIGDYASEVDIVNALTHGADDWIVKPVRCLELLARLEAITRRSGLKPQLPNMIDLGALRFDRESRTAWRDGRPIQLTAKDFDLSVLLLVNVGRLLSRKEISASVWGPRAVMSSRTLDTHICRIRHKLELTPSNGWRLAAVYGRGYRLRRSG
jgi:DNA-binding response OmpR family regulator